MMNKTSGNKSDCAEVVLFCRDFEANLKFFEEIGFSLEMIFPADNPREAVLSGFGIQICLKHTEAQEHPGSALIRISAEIEKEVTAPCGAKVVFTDRSREKAILEPVVSFQLNRPEEDNWVEGRAGMRYRDLIPDRLGGFLIASHIHVVDAGPVPDYVHYHDVQFQIIYCRTGWARLVYEDQGEPFIFNAGDCVLQPPGIRHRVLESSENLEVIEVSSPAEHVTYADNEMELPNGPPDPGRDYGGQRFQWSRDKDAGWVQIPEASMEYRDTGIDLATGGIVGVRVLRRSRGMDTNFHCESGRIVIYFLLNGMCSIRIDGEKPLEMKSGFTATLPKGIKYSLEKCSEDLEILEISV